MEGTPGRFPDTSRTYRTSGENRNGCDRRTDKVYICAVRTRIETFLCKDIRMVSDVGVEEDQKGVYRGSITPDGTGQVNFSIRRSDRYREIRKVGNTKKFFSLVIRRRMYE